MKHKVKFLISFILISVGFSQIYGKTANEPKSWIRPIKENKCFEKDGKTYYFYKDTYVQVEKEATGNIIINGDTLKTNDMSIADYNKRKDISSLELQKMITIADSLKNRLKIFNDTTIVFAFKGFTGSGDISVFVNGNYKGIQSFNKNDTVLLSKLGTSIEKDDLIVLSSDSILATYIPINIIVKEYGDTTNSNGDDNPPSLAFWESTGFIIIVCILGIIIALLGFITFKRKRNSRDQKKHGTENPLGSPNEEQPTIEYTEVPEEERLKTENSRLKASNSELEDKLRREKAINSDLTVKFNSAKEEIEEIKSNQEETIKRKVEKIEKDFNNKLNVARSECNKKVEAANRRAERAEDKAENISNELKTEFDKERQRARTEKEQLNRSLANKRAELVSVSTDLARISEALRHSQRQVEHLTVETASFHEHLSGVSDSKPYCVYILKLIHLAKRIQDSASILMQADIEDKYFVYKPLALYFGKLGLINLVNFYSDVEMISKTGFVIKGTPLASYDQTLPKEELESLTKNYFFITYLKTYIDALVVLNESFAGLHYLVEDIHPSDVMVFTEYRSEIEDIAYHLGINILTVKVFDSVGTNIDLQATEIDAGIEKHGAILEIENCKISLIGGSPNTERITVKVQK